MNPAHHAALHHLIQHPATNAPEFETALAAEALRRTRAFITGVQRYQNSPIQRDAPPAPIIARVGSVCLRDYNPHEVDAPIALVIPSLINRADILDLDTQHSFLRSVAKAGFRPLLVDWGTPDDDEKKLSIGGYVTERLIPLLDSITPAPTQKPLHIMGYCMGGLLALALATLRPSLVKTLSLLATPWDFHQPNKDFATHAAQLLHEGGTKMSATSPLAIDALQAFFAAINPLQAMEKFAAFAHETDDAKIRRFVVLEDWLNDGVPLAAPAARECVHDWYGANLTAQNQWRVAGQVIDPARITVPTYCLVPGKDRIVPPESALPLARAIPHVTLHEPMIGHIGLMASPRAPHMVWVPFLRWLAEHA